MKKNCFTSAAHAAVAMLLLFAVTACTKDKAPAPSEAGGCYVTVSAGFPATKTVAGEKDGVYTLKFTEGDRLYVHGTGVNMQEEGDWHMAGYLALTPNSITNDGKRAIFAGTLDLYNYSDGVYYLPDPITMNDLSGLSLDDCQDVSVCLIPAGATDDLLAEEQLNDQNQKTSIDVYVKDAVVQANDNGNPLPLLMSSAVDVRGKYDKDKKCIILNQSDDAIFDVTLPESINTSYSVALQLWDISSDPQTKLGEYSLEGSVSTIRFAVSVGIVGKAGQARLFMREQQGPTPSEEYSEKLIILGSSPSQCFERKIYNWPVDDD